MKHYLFYIPNFGGGGAERVATMLATQLSKDKNKVSFVVNTANGPHRSLLSHEIDLYELKPNSNLSSVFLLASLLKKIKPDYISCRIGICPIVGVLAGIFATSPAKLVIAYDSLFFPGGKLGYKATYYMVSILSYLSHSTVCVSSDIRNELNERFKASANKLRVIFNPIDFEELTRKSKSPFPKSLITYEQQKPYILSAGRFVEQKDFSLLIRAFYLIQHDIPHDLILLGEGPLEDSLRALICELSLENRIILPGFQENPFPIFRSASLFVLSSANEGFGNVLIEALALGVPVVSSNCPGGPKEILDGGKYGLLPKKGDDKALAEAITSTLNNPLSPEVLKKRAAEFSLDRITGQYRDLFENSD